MKGLDTARNGDQTIAGSSRSRNCNRHRRVAANQKVHRLPARAGWLMVRHAQLGARGVRRDRDRLAASGGVGLVGLAHRLKSRVDGH